MAQKYRNLVEEYPLILFSETGEEKNHIRM